MTREPGEPLRPTRAVRVGVQLPEVEYEARWPAIRAMARTAEAVGFDALWVGDHLLYRGVGPRGDETRGPWEAWTMLAALAAATERVAIGPLVACTAFHEPAMLAKMAATVDEVSGGRLVLGLGAGWNETEFAAFGLPFDRRIARFEEAFTIIRTLLRDGAIDFEGEFYRLRDCELVPRPRPRGPELMVGSTGPRMLSITAPHVDAWNAWYADTGNSPAGARAASARVDEACRAVGRDPTEVRRTVAVLVQLEGGSGRLQGDRRSGPVPLAGTADEIAAGIAAYAEAGIDEVQLVVDPITERSIASLGPVLERLDRLAPTALHQAIVPR